MPESVDPQIFLTLLERRAPRPLSIPEMARLLDLERYHPRKLKAVLEAQVAAHQLRRIGKTRYQWIREPERTAAAARQSSPHVARKRATVRLKQPDPVEGQYSRVRAGYGFVAVEGPAAERFARDILIPAGMEGGALHGDRVKVELIRRDARTHRLVGRITTVVTSEHAKIIGTLIYDRAGWHLEPENHLLPDVELLGTMPARQQAGQVALVRVTRPATSARGPGGAIEDILGAADDPEVQFLSIAFEFGVRLEFPPDALSECARLPADPAEGEFVHREDLRRLPFVTIDGETARDFDDAVCVEPHGRGGYRLYVAIADVSHYVKPGSALDREAAARGTSVYFPDRAVPMLPPELSNQLCSLNPQRPRLVLVAEMVYDRRGHRQSSRFYRGVITSQARLTYNTVAAVLSHTKTPDIERQRQELHPLLPQLRQMMDLMRLLLSKRLAAGSLDLDLPESMVDLSEEGRSIGVRLFQRNDAHRLIEEFMLEANCAVAEFLSSRDVPFPYRVHEAPDPADIDELNDFLQVFGLRVQYEGKVRPQDVQELLEQLASHPLARVLSRLVLRSLKQAHYSTLNAGHFGLAFPTYCHFTSPIRRYPDLIVHRQLGHILDADLDAARTDPEAVETASVRSSQCERNAMEAERAMLDLKKAEFMCDHLLESEPGTIVSVLSFGFFVELDVYPIEGLVRTDALTDDRYYFIEEEHALKGVRTRQRYRLGDRVMVEATDVSLRRREIDFVVLQRLETGTKPTEPARRRKGTERRERTRARARKKDAR